MQFSFEYEKGKTLQALRYHFLSRNEIKVLLVLINVFAIVSAVLFYSKRIRPEPFLLGTCVWIAMMVSIWYLLPMSIYKKSQTFKDHFSIQITQWQIRLDGSQGHVVWDWKMVIKHLETPYFFHIYFTEKSFFLIPKDSMNEEMKHEMRGYLNELVKK